MAAIDHAPDTAQRRTARRLAMVLGCELDRMNGHRAHLAGIYARALDTGISPAAHAAGLMGLAKVDTRRRALRELLADQLEATA